MRERFHRCLSAPLSGPRAIQSPRSFPFRFGRALLLRLLSLRSQLPRLRALQVRLHPRYLPICRSVEPVSLALPVIALNQSLHLRDLPLHPPRVQIEPRQMQPSDFYSLSDFHIAAFHIAAKAAGHHYCYLTLPQPRKRKRPPRTLPVPVWRLNQTHAEMVHVAWNRSTTLNQLSLQDNRLTARQHHCPYKHYAALTQRRW